METPPAKRRRRRCRGCNREFSGRQILRHHEESFNSIENTFKCTPPHSNIVEEDLDEDITDNVEERLGEVREEVPLELGSSDESDISLEINERYQFLKPSNVEDDDERAFFEDQLQDLSDESAAEEIETGDLSDGSSGENETSFQNSDRGNKTNKRSSTPLEISKWIALFILSWQSACYISDRAITHLVSFIRTLLTFLGAFTPLASAIADTIPTNVYGIRKLFHVQNDSFQKYVVCTKCFSLYLYKECITTIEGRTESRECSNVPFPNHRQRHMRKKCGQPLLKSLSTGEGKIKLIPFKTYCYYPLQDSLKSLFSRKKFLDRCRLWKERNIEPNVYRDVYDGKVWKDFKDNWNFFKEPNSIGLMLNLDWFQPFKHVSYSVGAIYAVVLNLPRSERFKKENTLLIGLIPNMKHEPPTNTFLEPLVDELQEAWSPGIKLDDGKSVRVALMCVGCDIPASRKLCGFLGHAATRGCNHCSKSFPGSVGEKCYGGFDRELWPKRTKERHLQQCRRINNATTKSDKEQLERDYGVRYSVLLRLPYFDPLQMTVVDPMHNLFLGTAKHMINIWKATDFLEQHDMIRIQELVDEIQCPVDIGKIPNKIASSFGGFNADQFINWTLIFSMYALQNVLPEEHLKCWQKFVLACKYICTQVITEQNIVIADRLLLEFCKSFERLYGAERVTPNMHLHCHLTSFIRNYGPIYSFWLFSFERDNGILGNYPVNMRDIEPQLMRRFIRDTTWTGELQIAMKTLSSDDDTHALATEITNMECRVKARGTLSKCDVADPYHLMQKASRTSNIHDTNWELPHTTQSVITNRRTKKSLDPQETDNLRKMYRQLYQLDESQLNEYIVPSSCYLSKEIYIYGTVIGSSMSRSRRSSFIMAHWGDDDCNNVSNGSVKSRPGEIESFLFHNLFIDGRVKPHILAKVHWYSKAPEVVTNVYGDPVQVWKNHFVEDGPASYMPVQRIKSKFVSVKRVVNHRNVVIVIPKEKYLL